MTPSRALLLLLTVGTTATFAHVLYQVLSVARLMPLQGVFLVLCTMSFAWIALGSSSALIGFVAALRTRKCPALETASLESSEHRTALLFPVCHEDAARVAATIEAIANDLIALGREMRLDVFVLSDSRASDVRSRELRAVRLLRKSLRGRLRLYYRVRAERVGKKAGNIADWVQTFGGAYDSFIILDADSIMSGSLIVRLRSMLAANPQVALIQTVPRLVEARTLFAHLQQFAVAFYGPVISAGFAAWHQGSGNYWGHNAIIRTRAFADAAGLPELPGRPPLGGHVQSHDFVEAAFLRRAGWEIRMLPDVGASYEECPPTLIETAARDRRWAQGNLQHLRIIAATGLSWVSRVHLAMGIYGYLASVIWAASLAVGLLLAFQSAYTLPVYFPERKTLFPIWPVIDYVKAFYLLLGTMAIVLLPKILGIALAFIRGDIATRTSGWFLLGAATETVFSVLMAPILMLTHTSAVTEVVRGRDSGWSAQSRGDVDAPHGKVVRFHRWHVLLGAMAGLAAGLVSPYVLAWMSPIVIGLLSAVLLSAITSRPAPVWLARALATPETLCPPPICSAVRTGYREWSERVNKRTTCGVQPGS